MKLPYKDFAKVTTTSLPARASEVIVAAAIEQLQYLVGMRSHIKIDRVSDEGARKYIYSTYDDLTDAFDRAEGEDFKYDAADASDSTADFVEIDKGFMLSWEADHLKKLNIKADQTKACVNKVRDREDYKIIAPLSSGTSSVTAGGVLSGTSADPVGDIREGIRKCLELGYKPDKLLIEHANLEELITIIGSNDWYRITEDTIRTGGISKFMGLDILATDSGNLSHGTGYVFKGGAQGALQMGQAHDIRTHIFDDDENHCTKVQVFERVCPVLVRPDASATITGW